MNQLSMSQRSCAKAISAVVFGLWASGAQAQSHVEKQGPYLLRSSSVSTMNLSADSARQHGIERADRRAVLNVVVQKVGEGNRLSTVPADVKAQVKTLAGVVRDVDMTASRANGYVSYSGVYSYLPRQVMDITVSAKPEGAQETLKLTYRDRMWDHR